MGDGALAEERGRRTLAGLCDDLRGLLLCVEEGGDALGCVHVRRELESAMMPMSHEGEEPARRTVCGLQVSGGQLLVNTLQGLARTMSRWAECGANEMARASRRASDAVRLQPAPFPGSERPSEAESARDERVLLACTLGPARLACAALPRRPRPRRIALGTLVPARPQGQRCVLAEL